MTASGQGGGATSGPGGGGGGMPTIDCSTSGAHLLINELATGGGPAEFVEILNAGSTAVDLAGYYLSDNAAYDGIAIGQAWMPMATAETDFLAGFPNGTSIDAGATLVIQTGTDFENTYMRCPDLVLSTSSVMCDGQSVPAMVAPSGGGIGNKMGSLLSNSREMLMLFCWDGIASTVEDVDYVTWGSAFEPATRVDKTGIAGYAADTPKAEQKAAPAPASGKSIGRCGATEPGETASGGNGVDGHDETSEDMAVSFAKEFDTPSPGAANNCN
jgi:hypothetical protein